MAETAAEARIRDLKRRLEQEPGSRLFVALAEEYRKTGRPTDALITLQKGLLAHPNYLSAQVALGRAYLETGLITEAIATFSRVLSSDPGNLVSAKSLGDIYLSRGDNVEAIKKYKLYRALSGDRTVDEVIERLEVELAPPPALVVAEEKIAPPPSPFFEAKPAAPITRSISDSRLKDAAARRSPADLELTPVAFEPEDSHPSGAQEEAPLPLSRDLPLPSVALRAATAQPIDSEAATRAIPPQETAAAVAAATGRVPVSEPPAPPAAVAAATGRVPVSEPPAPPVTVAATPVRVPVPEPPAPPIQKAVPPSEIAPQEPEPQGRVLADLYFVQGHYAEALAIYDDLVAAHPHDEELRRLRRDAEARLLPAAAATPAAAAPDSALERRLAKIRALKRWLAVVQTG